MEDRSEPGVRDHGPTDAVVEFPAGFDRESRSEFVDIAAHELRGLITVVYAGSHLLRGGTLDEASRQEILDDMEQAAEKLQRDVDGLTMLARMALTPPHREAVRLQDMVPRVVEKFQELHRCGQVDVCVDDNLPELSVVAAYLDLSFRNLLSAVDEVAAADRPREVRAAPAAGEAILSVSGWVEPGLTAQLVVDAFAGKETPPGQRRRIAPIITRAVIASQGGRVSGLMVPTGRLELALSLPFVPPGP